MAMKKAQILAARIKLNQVIKDLHQRTDAELLAIVQGFFAGVTEGTREELLVAAIRFQLDELFPDHLLR